MNRTCTRKPYLKRSIHPQQALPSSSVLDLLSLANVYTACLEIPRTFSFEYCVLSIMFSGTC